MAKKKRKSKKSKRRLAIFGTLSVLAIAYFIFNLCYYSYRISVLEKSKQNLQQQLTVLEENEEKLNSDIQKLKDPEYIAKYARENYMYSKDGEYIIKIEDEEQETNEDNEKIDYKYLIIVSSLGLVIIILYIIKKNSK